MRVIRARKTFHPEQCVCTANSTHCARRQADGSKVCGSPYRCRLRGVTGIAVREMGRSHPLKNFVLKILNFI